MRQVSPGRTPRWTGPEDLRDSWWRSPIIRGRRQPPAQVKVECLEQVPWEEGGNGGKLQSPNSSSVQVRNPLTGVRDKNANVKR